MGKYSQVFLALFAWISPVYAGAAP